MRALACSVVGAAVAVAVIASGHAQPAPDIAHAKELYQSAETAMSEQRYADAVREYGLAYEITKDPVLFYKIASANERNGRCDIALAYYRRYLKEANPSEVYITLTRTRISACGGDAGSGSDAGSDAGSGSGNGSAGSAAGSGSAVLDAGSGSAPPPTSTKPATPHAKHRVAWLLVGGSIATLTVGAVLAYSANASESDISDLYVGLGGTPPAFDAKTKARFDELVSQGHRYQNLSRASFAIAGALAIGAAIRFATDKPETDKGLQITPIVSPQSAGVSAIVRF